MAVLRRDLVKYFEEGGYYLLREGKKHSIYTNAVRTVPIKRHRTIDRITRERALQAGWTPTKVLNGWEYTPMRTNIDIDDKLMRDALRATGLETKREVVELGLRTLVRLSNQAEFRRLRGKADWEGDLEFMRNDR